MGRKNISGVERDECEGWSQSCKAGVEEVGRAGKVKIIERGRSEMGERGWKK